MFAVEVGISFFRVKNWQEKIMAAITPLKTLQKMEKKKKENRKPQAGPVVYLAKGNLILGKKGENHSGKKH